ncbi:MAG TPA: hypothetical protein H9669_07265, partial [Firmicutes bacterium]|nr:hypothetical protein [Bacillota bacterium]
MEAYSGKYKIIDSGNIITFDENSGISIVVKPNIAFSFKVSVEFEENGGERDIVKTVDEKSNEVKIKCINFEMGAGTVEPLELATASGKKVFFHLWVEKIAANKYIRSIQYT